MAVNEGWVKTVGEKLNQYGLVETAWTHYCTPCGNRRLISTRFIKPERVDEVAQPECCRFCAEWAIQRLFHLFQGLHEDCCNQVSGVRQGI